MVGLRDFIPEHRKLPIEQAFASLREEVCYEEAVNQINLALYIFQDAVSVCVCVCVYQQHFLYEIV